MYKVCIIFQLYLTICARYKMDYIHFRRIDSNAHIDSYAIKNNADDKLWLKYVIQPIYHIFKISYVGNTSRRLKMLYQLSADLQKTCNFHMRWKKLKPCGTLKLSIDVTNRNEWSIHINKHFAINMTIYKSYLMYSDDCSAVQLGVAGTKDSGLDEEKFCGHILLETIYTRHNSMTVYVDTTIDTWVLLDIRYQNFFFKGRLYSAFRY